jgi:hypothetical protein
MGAALVSPSTGSSWRRALPRCLLGLGVLLLLLVSVVLEVGVDLAIAKDFRATKVPRKQAVRF